MDHPQSANTGENALTEGRTIDFVPQKWRQLDGTMVRNLTERV